MTFEHVPPRAALNDCPAVGKHILELINKDPDNYLDSKGYKYQRGVGAYTLCSKCNSNTGTWYGGAFAEWARQSLDILKHTKGSPSLYYRFHIYPLRVIKQIICLFFSINNDLFRCNHQDLVKFVLNKNECHLNPGIQILAYFNVGPHTRFVGGTSIAKMGGVSPNEMSRDTMDNLLSKYQHDYAKSRSLSEIAFPPLGYVMSFSSERLDNQLFDISFFAKYRYDDRVPIPLLLPVHPVYTCYPTDYRSREQIRRDFEENSQIEKEIQEGKQGVVKPAEPSL